MGIFTETKNKALRVRSNVSAPKAFADFNNIDIGTLKGKTITISKVVVRQKPYKDKVTKEIKLRKDGTVINKPVVFISFGDGNYTATTSSLMVSQIGIIEGKNLETLENGDYEVSKIAGMKVKIEFEKVKYANNKEYDNAIFTDPVD